MVVGHLSGLVQVYQPAARPDTTSRAEDLLLELQLSSPVLQLLCGTLVSGTGSCAAQYLGTGSSAAQYVSTGSSAALYLYTVSGAALEKNTITYPRCPSNRVQQPARD